MNNISLEQVKYFYKSRHLPHVFDRDRPIFITFRLKFTLPRALLQEYNQRRADWHSRLKELNDQEKAEASKTKDGIFFAWFDELISQSKEVPQILHRDELRSIIAGARSYHDNIRYELLAYCIMPNHVHVLILPIINHNDTIFSPARILFTWKRFTTKAINKTLNRKGALWQKENYDRMVRDEKELYNTINYIIQNPVKAGLVSQWEDWAGTYVRPDFFS